MQMRSTKRHTRLPRATLGLVNTTPPLDTTHPRKEKEDRQTSEEGKEPATLVPHLPSSSETPEARE